MFNYRKYHPSIYLYNKIIIHMMNDTSLYIIRNLINYMEYIYNKFTYISLLALASGTILLSTYFLFKQTEEDKEESLIILLSIKGTK